MKIFYSILFALFVLVSCGKYEKPFISFKSPEKRICNTWSQNNYVTPEGLESQFEESISFSINNEDSVFTRVINGTTTTGSWTWMPALDGKVDKERVRVNCEGFNKVLTIKVLTKKNLEFIDQSSDFRYFYSKL
jgi:hypothetical protein